MQTQEPVILSAELPETANFMRQVELNRTIEGVYSLAKLARLSEALVSNDGYVTTKIEFGRSVGFACVSAKVSATLLVKCQRCLKPLETEVAGNFKFALVHSEDEFELLPEEFEPFLLEGEQQSIIDLIEDELILCLPMVMTHENDCSDYMAKQNKKVKAAIEAEKESSHPFAALKSLKNDLSN
ncbi:MAG: DUF177 domain-containing protein [Gammaproteobacteria bacterium]|nr:DUF177 domain-containing protein [Gammaproteobacteria bacterium]